MAAEVFTAWLLAGLAIALLPLQAVALDCAEPDPVFGVQAIALSEHTYLVISGDMTATAAGRRSGDRVSFPMQITGRALGRNGFAARRTVAFDQIFARASAQDCPDAAIEGEALVFLRQIGAGSMLEGGLCGENQYFGAGRAVRDAVAACFLRCDC